MSPVRYLNPADHNPGRIAKVYKGFPKKLHFKDIIIPVKARDIQKIKKKIQSALLFQIDAIFLLKISIHLFKIIHYIVAENIFAAVVYKLLFQKNYSIVTTKIAFKLMVNKGL